MLTKIMRIAALTVALHAQSVVPTKAGLISYSDEAWLDDRPVEITPGRFAMVNQNSILRTGAGRAELLLGPCAAMWVDEHSSFRILSNALTDARIELLTGSIVVAAGDMTKGTKLTLLLAKAASLVDRHGAYRFDAASARIKVLAGQTTVQWLNQRIPIGAGEWLPLEEPASVRKFSPRDPDPLELWSNRRAAYLARLSGQQTDAVQPAPRPVAPDDMENSRAATRRRQAEAPLSPPSFPAHISGCAVESW
jgi:hypothetical protein